MSASTSAYLDTQTLLSDSFSPTAHANSLILRTNNATDTPLDLSTPLSKLLFDAQEIDTHIDALTTQSAQPLLAHARTQRAAASEVLGAVEEHVARLNESYARLEHEVGARHRAAEEVRLAAERMLATLRLGRAVQRVVALGRQLEGQMEEVSSPSSAARASGGHRGLPPAARTVLELRAAFVGKAEDALARVAAARAVRQDLLAPSERSLVSRAQGIVKEYSPSGLSASSSGSSTGGGGGGEGGAGVAAAAATAAGGQTYAQAEEAKARATSALHTLYLLSPIKASAMTAESFEPILLLSALQSYLQTALTSSVASLSRALATLPSLDRALLEISARCQNIIALETLLESTKPPAHPLLLLHSPSSPPLPRSEQPPPDTTAAGRDVVNHNNNNLLQPLLRHLDTASLPSYFWRSLAGQLTAKVQEILVRGGVSARTLRSNRDRVRDALRECVDRGYRGASREGKKLGSWEREAAVMVGSVVGPLQR